tara:strand:+ start:71 stop:706 length:636 start_codon:yes stop_codon:yes gene_type:complete
MRLIYTPNYAEAVELGRRSNQAPPRPANVKVLPTFTKIDTAFNSFNKELNKKKGRPLPLPKSIYNLDVAGNGARGRMVHTKANELKVAGNDKIQKAEKPEKVIQLDAEQVAEDQQRDDEGTEKRGLMKTDPEKAKKFIRRYGGVLKFNRGIHRTSGHYSGGKLRREYEASTIRLSTAEGIRSVDDEFASLQKMIQETQVPDNKLMVSQEGM